MQENAMTVLQSPRLIFGLAAVTLLAGCRSDYRCETIVRPDGQVERAVYQPVSNTPDATRKEGVWQQLKGRVPTPEQLEREGRPVGIRQLLARPELADQDQAGSYFAAWGTFPSAKQIPDHLVFKAPEGARVPDGRLVRDHQRTDYVFVVEHRWRETLTNVVQLEDMRRAREELIELLADVWGDTFHEAVGQDYQADALVQWLKTEGKAWAGELTDAAFVHFAAHKGPTARQAFLPRLAEICGRHGLELNADGQLLKGDAVEERIKAFATELVCRHVRRRADGERVERESATAWVKLLFGSDDEPRKWRDRFKTAEAKVIAKRFGDRPSFDRRTEALLVRVGGLYAADWVFENQHFHYTLTMPGTIVETNGEIMAENRACWRFTAHAAYPSGYEMTCRSLAPQVEVQLLGGRPLNSAEGMTRFVEIVNADRRLPEVLEACRKQKKMQPLVDYRNAQGNPRLDELLRLLGLPVPGSPAKQLSAVGDVKRLRP
jgi:hypothetical protein